MNVRAEPQAGSITIGALAFVADPTGALYHPGERLLVVADLHFEKGSAFAERGVLLPPYDTRSTLNALALLIARYAPETVIALGDSLHDQRADERLDRGDLATLRRIAARPRLDLGHRQSRSCRAARAWRTRRRHAGPSGRRVPARGQGWRRRGSRRAPASGGAHSPARPFGAAALFRCRQRSVACCRPSARMRAGSTCATTPSGRCFPDGITAHVLGTERIFTIAEGMLLPD